MNAPTEIAVVTRERLLDAAGEIFAAHGFNHATVREICERAGANIAAVNYHFGDKRGLYNAVFEHASTCSASQDPLAIGPAKQRLRAYVQNLLSCVVGIGKPAWLAKLMLRGMTDHTDTLDALVERSIRPTHKRLYELVRELAGDRLDEPAVHRCARSIVAECVFYGNARTLVERLEPKLRFTAHEIDAHAEHITEFSLGGIERLAKRAGGRS